MSNICVGRGELEILSTVPLGALHRSNGQEPEIPCPTSSSHDKKNSFITHAAFIFVERHITPCYAKLPCPDEIYMGQVRDDIHFCDMVWQPWDVKVAGVC